MNIYSQKSIYLILIMLAFFLSGCSSKKQLLLPQNMTPEARAEYLQRIQYWAISGRIGIITPDESNTANLYWQKDKNRVTLRLYGTLGTTYALLTSEPGKAKIELPDDQIMYGSDPRQLLWQATGWDIPVNEMQQWIMGVYSNAPHYELNEARYVSAIEFDHWRVDFQKYDDFYGMQMPRKIKAKHPDITLKFAIHDWEFVKND